MRPAWHLAINSLVKTRNRAFILALCVAVATSLVVAVASAMATVSINIQLVLAQFVGLTDFRLVQSFGGRFDQSVLQQFQSLPEVTTAAARFSSGFSLYNPDTKQSHTLLALGVQPQADRTLHPAEILEGRWLTGPGEIVLDPGSLKKLGAKVGSKIQLLRLSGSVPLTVVGIAARPELGILQKPSAMMDLTQVQSLTGFENQVDEIGLHLAPGVSPEAFEARYKPTLPSGIAFQNAAGATAGINRAIQAAHLMLILLTMLVFLCASFIILTSLTTDVAQRTRELAILRCIGATRLQVFTSQVFIGVVISAVGAIIGIPIGLLLSYALYARFEENLKAGFSFGGFGLALAVAGASAAGIMGSLYPAWRASRVSPLEALATRARITRPRAILACLAVGLLFAGGSAAMAFIPGIENNLRVQLHIVLGMPLLFIGFFLLGVPFIVLVTKSLGRAVELSLGLPPAIVTQNIAASPYRFGFTAGALMVSLAMLVSLWTAGRSLITGWLDNIQMPDGFAHSYYALTPDQWNALRTTPGVTLASPTTMFPINQPQQARFGLEGISPTNTAFVSFDPNSFFQLAPLEFVQGNQADAIEKLNKGNAVLVSREYLAAHKIGVGSKLTFKTRDGPVDFEVVGVVASPGLDLAVAFFGIQRIYSDASLSCVFGSRADALKHFGVDAANLILMKFDPNVPDKQILESIRKNVPGVVPGSARRIRAEILRSTGHALSIMSTIAVVTLLIACIGVANLIIASLTARRFEMGVLRAVGASRWLLARLVLAETILVAITGSLLGAIMGITMAYLAREFHQKLLGIIYTPQIAFDAIAYGSIALTLAATLASIPAILSLVRTPTRVMIASE